MADAKTNDVVQQALARLEAQRQPQLTPVSDAVTYPAAPTSDDVQAALARYEGESQGIPGALVSPDINAPAPVGIAAPAVLPTVPPPADLSQVVPQMPELSGVRFNYNRALLPAEKSAFEVAAEEQAAADKIARQQQLAQTGLPGLVSVGIAPEKKAAPSPAVGQQPTLEQLITPTREEVDRKTDELTKQHRENRAAGMALDRVSEMERESQERMRQMEDEAKEKIRQLDNEVRTRSLPQIISGGSFGEKLGAAVALGLGAVSQGLSGARTNPVMDFLDRQAEQQAQRDKLNLEQKEALRRQLYEQGSLELRKLEQATQNDFRKQSLQMQRQQMEAANNQALQKMLMDAYNKQQTTGKFSGKALTPEQEATLTLEERRYLVDLPDGRRVLVQSPTDAQKFKDSATAIQNALSSLDEIEELGRSGSKFSLKDRARANAALTKIVGALRLPYTGPGVLTDSERQMLADTLGNPLAIFSLRSIEMEKLKQVRNDLLANMTNEARLRGIREDVVPQPFYNVNGKAKTEQEVIRDYQQKYPGLRPEQILTAVRKQRM